ncbi:MAG: ribosome biosis GTPase Der [Pseudomonadota bacterium]
MAMLPVIAIVGRPNVGKSTLFNQVTRTRQALVVDLPGVTRDRQFGEAYIEGQKCIVIDTGGIAEPNIDPIFKQVTEQTWQAIAEAHVIWWVVDAQVGITPGDDLIIKALRQRVKTPVMLVANKIDGTDFPGSLLEFYRLGLGEPQGISATHRRGFAQLFQETLGKLPQECCQAQDLSVVDTESLLSAVEDVQEEASLENPPLPEEPIKMAIVGRPNVGKSTLVNRLLGEERVIAFDAPGTTRDSIYIPFTRQETAYVLIDTAGMRRRARIEAPLEKFSVIKTLQAIEDCHVAILVIDAQESLTDQDLGILRFIIETGRGLIIAVNKWDGLSPEKRKIIQGMLTDRLRFAKFALIHYISALHGSGVGDLWKMVNSVYKAATKTLSTALLTRLLQQAIAAHQPPMVRGRRIKLRYAHAGGHNPPIIIVHGNQTEDLPESYRRYLSGYFYEALNLQGTPVEIQFKTSENPYAGRRNTLTPRQQHKRDRQMRHFKKKKK